MVALVIVLGIVIVWLVVLRFFIRPVSDERSLDHYHDTLDRLGKLADSTPVRAPLPTEAKPHAHVRVLWPGEEPAPPHAPAPIPARPPPEPPPEPPEPPEPPDPQTGVAESEISDSATPVEELDDDVRPVVKFDDFVGAASAGTTTTSDLPIPTAAISAEHASDREALRAAYGGRHRWSTRFTLPHPVIPRVRVSLRILLALLATAFLVSLLVREFIGPSEPDTIKADKTEASSTTVRRASTTTEATTGAVTTPVSLVGSTATSREYEVGAAPFELTLSAESDCWVQVLDGGSNGQPLFTGTIPAGERKSFTAERALWVRIGVPGAVTVTVDDGEVPSLPSGSDPVNALFTAERASG